MPFTTREIKSHTSGKVYAPFAAEVEIVREGHPMLVKYKENIFPCLVDDLCDHVPEVINLIITPNEKVKATKTKSTKRPIPKIGMDVSLF